MANIVSYLEKKESQFKSGLPQIGLGLGLQGILLIDN